MTTQQQRTFSTYEDYLKTPDDERYELLDGELVMVPAPEQLKEEVSKFVETIAVADDYQDGADQPVAARAHTPVEHIEVERSL